jgi:hypothetical protein
MHIPVKRLMICATPVIAAVLLMAESTPTIKIRDDCQPSTFNLPPPDGAGPGVCQINFSGNTSFAKFIDQLTKHQDAPLWRFTPQNRDVEAGTQLSLDNYGGEPHTFTRVQAFGGGFILPLNALPATRFRLRSVCRPVWAARLFPPAPRASRGRHSKTPTGGRS